MANPKYGTTASNVALLISTDKKVRKFWVESVGGDVVWFRYDGTEPQIGADDNYFLPASGGSLSFELPSAQNVTVQFKAAGAVKVSVRTP